MATKKFNKEQLSRGKSILNPDDDFNPDEFTYDVISDFEKNPKKEDLPKVVEVIKNDSQLPAAQKEALIARLKEDFIGLFGLEDIPDDYESLKNESKFLADLAHYSFLCLAVRLKKIRDNELYKEDGYSDFKSFIDSELPIKRATAYNYIDLVTVFGVQTFGHVQEPSKLIPALPLLRSAQSNSNIPAAKIKKDIIEQSQTMSARELNDHIKTLKVEYGFTKPAPPPEVSPEEYYSKWLVTIGKSIRKAVKEYEALEKNLYQSVEKLTAEKKIEEANVYRTQAQIYTNVVAKFMKIYDEAETVLKKIQSKQPVAKKAGKGSRK